MGQPDEALIFGLSRLVVSHRLGVKVAVWHGQPMGMKRWPHAPGTCRALRWAGGRHLIVCHPCKRAIEMPGLDLPFDPCPFICKRCGTRGEITDAEGVPSGYEQQGWTEPLPPPKEFLAPKLRRKPAR